MDSIYNLLIIATVALPRSRTITLTHTLSRVVWLEGQFLLLFLNNSLNVYYSLKSGSLWNYSLILTISVVGCLVGTSEDSQHSRPY